MLVRFFLIRFLSYFTIFLVVFTLLFGLCDTGVRLALLPSMSLFAQFFVLMLPLMMLFSLPLASTLAVQIVFGSLLVNEEIVLLHYWKKARWALNRALLIFALMVTSLFIPLSWYLVPQSYWNGKLFLVQAAQQHIDSLPENSFHTVIPGFTFFFKQKEGSLITTTFHELIVMIRDKRQVSYLITAQTGTVCQGVLSLSNGSLFRQNSPYFSHATFKEMKFDLIKLLEKNEPPGTAKGLKFQTMHDLYQQKPQSNAAWCEFHKRLAQVAWHMSIPFLAVWSIKRFGRRKSNLLISLLLSGMIFLAYYIFTSTAGSLSRFPSGLFILAYGTLLSLLGTGYYLYRRTW